MRKLLPATCAAAACLLCAFADEPAPTPATTASEFVVPPNQIIKEEVHEQGGREIIVREIEPINLPEPEQPVQPREPVDPEARRLFLERMATRPVLININAGATIYRSANAPVRSLVKIFGGDGQPVEFWSSADFGLLAGLPEFVGNDGKQRRMMLFWSTMDLDRMQAVAARIGKPYQSPQFPELPIGAATFVVKSGHPDAATLANIQALHDVYNSRHAELLTAAEAIKAEQARHAAELIANPPVPKDIILNHWRIGGADQEGGNQ